MTKEDVHNVVVFGETGAGKSSLINMIAGHQVAETSSRATGCTFHSTPYHVDIGGTHVTLWDTAGLNEGEIGTVAAKDAIINLYKLLRSLQDGLSLLVYCVRGRIKTSTIKNYMMFYHGLCQGKIPIVLVVTGLELEHSMDDWWEENRNDFLRERMFFDGHACIAATKGKLGPTGYMFEREYEESKEKVLKLIGGRCRGVPWKMKTALWMISAVKNAINFWTGVFKVQPLVLSRILYEVLMEHAGLSNNEARKLANDAEKSIAPQNGPIKENCIGDNHSPVEEQMVGEERAGETPGMLETTSGACEMAAPRPPEGDEAARIPRQEGVKEIVGTKLRRIFGIKRKE
jgi:small GTP-binding protein